MKFDIEEHRKYCIASDTDSCFFNSEPLIKKLGLENESEEVKISEVKKISLKYAEKLNKQLGVFARNYFNISKHYFEFKTESILKSAYWAGKRRYAQYIVDKEGVAVEELDMKGLDLMKSNFPPLFRDFGEKIIKDIMFGKTKDEIDEQVLEFKESLKNIDWKKLLKPTGLKKLKEYIDKKPDKDEIFSLLKSKCPINTKAAIIYNDLLKYWGLNKKYSLFQVGDKMNIIYLNDNPYRIKVIGFNGYKDPPEIIKLIEEFVDRESMFESVMQKKLEKLYKDLGWDGLILNPKIHEFFKF